MQSVETKEKLRWALGDAKQRHVQ